MPFLLVFSLLCSFHFPYALDIVSLLGVARLDLGDTMTLPLYITLVLLLSPIDILLWSFVGQIKLSYLIFHHLPSRFLFLYLFHFLPPLVHYRILHLVNYLLHIKLWA